MDWLQDYKIPLGKWIADGVEWLTLNADWFFDGLQSVLQNFVDSILWVLASPPFWVIAIICTLWSYWYRRSILFSIFVFSAFLFIVNQGFWEETMQTVTLVLASTFVCMLIGVPSGIVCAHRPKFYRFVLPILDLMQTVPTFVYLLPALILFGLGLVPGLIATVIFALPSSIRLTQLGVSSTPVILREAGRAFGANSWQLLWKVELPYALPQIMAGLTQTIMLSLSMVVIAALVGADGLGVPTVRALNQVKVSTGFEVGLVIVLVAIILDRLVRYENRDKRK